MNTLDKVQEAMRDFLPKTPQIIIIPEKDIKPFLRAVESHCRIPKNSITALRGFKLEGIRVIASREVDKIEVL